MLNLDFLLFDFFSLGGFLPMPYDLARFIFGAVVLPSVLAYVIKKVTYQKYPYGSVSLLIYSYVALVVSHYHYPFYYFLSFIVVYFVLYMLLPLPEYRLLILNLKSGSITLENAVIYYSSASPYYAEQRVFSDFRRIFFGEDIPIDTNDVPILTSMMYDGKPVIICDSAGIEIEKKENPGLIEKIVNPNIKKFVITPSYVHKYTPYDFFETSRIFSVMNEEVSNLSEEYHLLEAEKNIHINSQVGERVKYFVDKMSEVLFLGQPPKPDESVAPSTLDKKENVVSSESDNGETEDKEEQS